jgi:alpha-D-ribose 1-methylphosphonate 5-triphosphate synthase subunit PhnH
MQLNPHTAAITPGFANPVMQSQATFRVIMSAMAAPGRWHELTSEVIAPAGLPAAAALVLLTLADFETPVWLPSGLRIGDAGNWLRFHCNCPIVEAPAAAAFAFVTTSNDPAMPRLHAFAAGDERFPDRSATVLVQTGGRDGGPTVGLLGPGIETPRRIAPAGLAPEFWADAVENSKRYPLGIDLLLIEAAHIMALPRSTRIDGGI